MRQRLRVALAGVLWIGLQAVMAHAAGAHGATGATALAASCTGCHGAAGRGNPALPAVPYLAGLPAEYLQRQLSELADGARQGGAMSAVAHALTRAQMQALAAYFSDLAPPGAPPTPGTPRSSELGKQLAEHGRWSRGLPACMLCHGRGGVGVGSAFPRLAGQPSLYLADQLRAFRDGRRAAGPLGLMKVVASKLSPRDIRAVAMYFSRRRPAPRPQVHR